MHSLQKVAAGPALYDVVRAELDAAGRLPDPALALPDEAVDEGGIRFAAGAFDGALGHHAGLDQAPRLRATVRAFEKVCRRPTTRRQRALYALVREPDALAMADPLVEALADSGLDRGALGQVGRWLATTSADRGAVKIGLAVLGLTGVADALDVVRALGAHEEFTLYAAVALRNGLQEPDSELWALAAATDGWGRIQCVERLAGVTDPAIKDWLLREGFRNSVMNEYLAHIAATTGDLRAALEAADVDRELLTGAGDIIQALLTGGPAEDIADYADGAAAVVAYLEHVARWPGTLTDLRTVTMIRGFLRDDQDWDALTDHGWTAATRQALERWCDDVLARRGWDDVVRTGLDSDDHYTFWMADQAARARGVDTFDLHVARLRADPFGGSWYDAWTQADTARAERLAGLVREVLPLDEVPTGAADELGMGPAWRTHMALDWTLQALRDHPGVGADLVLIGLESPTVRNRNMALHALKDWPRAQWPSEAPSRVEHVRGSDPRESVRELAAEVLDGESS